MIAYLVNNEYTSANPKRAAENRTMSKRVVAESHLWCRDDPPRLCDRIEPLFRFYSHGKNTGRLSLTISIFITDVHFY